MPRSGGRFDFGFENSRSRIVVGLGQFLVQIRKKKATRQRQASIKSLAKDTFFQIGEYLMRVNSSDKAEKESRERGMENMSQENKNHILRKGFSETMGQV